MTPIRTLLAAALFATPLALGACTGKQTDIVNGPTYPTVTQSSVINVHVLRDGTSVSMTNTSATTFANARLWANQWYSHELPEWKPGQTITLGLADFKDRYGTAMRAGGFWATENPEKLVLMQIEQDKSLVGLVVIGQSE